LEWHEPTANIASPEPATHIFDMRYVFGPTLEYQLDDRRPSTLSAVHSLFHPPAKKKENYRTKKKVKMTSRQDLTGRSISTAEA